MAPRVCAGSVEWAGSLPGRELCLEGHLTSKHHMLCACLSTPQEEDESCDSFASMPSLLRDGNGCPERITPDSDIDRQGSIRINEDQLGSTCPMFANCLLSAALIFVGMVLTKIWWPWPAYELLPTEQLSAYKSPCDQPQLHTTPSSVKPASQSSLSPQSMINSLSISRNKAWLLQATPTENICTGSV